MEEESEKIARLIRSLSHPDKKVIRQAAEALISLAPRQPELTEKLHQLLSQTPGEQRWPIAYVLAHISSPSSSCLDVLKETLDSSDPDIRWAASLLLSRLGKNISAIVALMLELLKSGSPTQRRMTVYCLRDMELKETALVRALLESLGDPDPLVRVAAATSLKARPEIGKEGLDSLLHLFLQDPDPRVRYAAAFTLAELGAPTEAIRKALRDASQSEDPQLKKAANAALGLLVKRGPTPPE